MWTSHASLGVAITVLYFPALVASFLLVARHGCPRRAWIFLAALSLIRVSSGIVLIINERSAKPSIGLSTTTATLLGVGVYPLILCLIGLLSICQVLDFKEWRGLHFCILAVRVTTGISITLLVTGVCLRYSVDNVSTSTIGFNLAKAGALLAAVALIECLTLQVACWSHGVALSKTSRTILIALLPAIVLVGLRTVYLCIAVFQTEPNNKWNALTGSIGLFVGIAIVPEYLCLIEILTTGFLIPRVKGSSEHGITTKLTRG